MSDQEVKKPIEKITDAARQRELKANRRQYGALAPRCSW